MTSLKKSVLTGLAAISFGGCTTTYERAHNEYFEAQEERAVEICDVIYQDKVDIKVCEKGAAVSKEIKKRQVQEGTYEFK